MRTLVSLSSARANGTSDPNDGPPQKRIGAVKRCKIRLAEGRPWTEEHGYPSWVRKEVMAWYRSLPKGVAPPGWEQSSSSKLHPVCKTCQQRLNEDFEIPAADLLRAMMGNSVMLLSPGQQVVLAAWFVKTSYVLALCPRRLQSVSPRTSKRFGPICIIC